jgi:hypothetical protein
MRLQRSSRLSKEKTIKHHGYDHQNFQILIKKKYILKKFKEKINEEETQQIVRQM